MLLKILINLLAVGAAAYLVPGVEVSGIAAAFLVVVVLAVINTLVKPILVLLTLPITLLTLGLFMFVINALVVLLVAQIVPGFAVDGFVPALLFSVVTSVVGSILGSLKD